MAGTERRKLSEILLFCGPCLPLAGVGLPMVVTLPAYYAKHLGVSLSVVGAAFLWVRLVDIFFDPILGGLMDRTRTRLGRFKPWLIASAPVLMLSTWMLFMAMPGVTSTYLWVWLLVIYLGFSMGSLSQSAWASALSPHYHERSRIFGAWQAGNVLGMLLVLTLPPLVTLGLHGTVPEGVQAMGWYVIILLPLTILVAAWKVDEPVVTAERERSGFAEYFALMKNASVRKLMLADLLMGWAPGITGALFIFYFDRIKHIDEKSALALLFIYFAGGLIGAPIWTWLARAVGKHRALAFNAFAVVASEIMVQFTPLPDMARAAVVMGIAGLPYSGAALLLRAMLADVGDELRLTSSVDRTGLLYAILTGTTKIGYALASSTFVILGLAGFKANATSGTEGLLALQLLFIGLPSLLSLWSAAVIWTYPLTAKRHDEIRAELARRDAEAITTA